MQYYRELCEIQQNTAVALGCFDGVHLGHTRVISSAADCKKDGLLPLVFTFSDSVKGLSGRLSPESEKCSILEALSVGAVVSVQFCSVRELSPESFVSDILCRTLHAKKVFCGFNYRFGKGGSAGCSELTALCAGHGISVGCTAEQTVSGVTVSSSAIRRFLLSGEPQKAAAMLGRPYFISGEVIHGNGLGRTLNAPTLNISADPEKLLPKYGVYAATVSVGGRQIPAVVNIGVKPTVGADRPTVEAYLLTGDLDLYGQTVSAELRHFIRPEQKFDDMTALSTAIRQDALTAAGLLKQPKS